MEQPTHPALRFKAPRTIVAGSPLKNLIGGRLVRLISESISRAHPAFPAEDFERDAVKGLSALNLMGRAERIARSMHRHLPGEFQHSARILRESFGPELPSTDGNGLAPFFYLPHASYSALFGVDHFEDGMKMNYELTKRFTAEFSVRPYLVRHPEAALDRLRRWTQDPNPHVRRLVSEGTRPRLPWSFRLSQFQRDPAPVLALLDLLKDDVSLYVRRSVANNLGDIAKDHPGIAIRTCRRWLEELSGLPENQAKQRCWLIRHAVRLPARKGVAEAVQLRRATLCR